MVISAPIATSQSGPVDVEEARASKTVNLFMMRQTPSVYLVCAISNTYAAKLNRQHKFKGHLICNSLPDECVGDKAPVQKGLPCDRSALMLLQPFGDGSFLVGVSISSNDWIQEQCLRRTSSSHKAQNNACG